MVHVIFHFIARNFQILSMSMLMITSCQLCHFYNTTIPFILIVMLFSILKFTKTYHSDDPNKISFMYFNSISCQSKGFWSDLINLYKREDSNKTIGFLVICQSDTKLWIKNVLISYQRFISLSSCGMALVNHRSTSNQYVCEEDYAVVHICIIIVYPSQNTV